MCHCLRRIWSLIRPFFEILRKMCCYLLCLGCCEKNKIRCVSSSEGLDEPLLRSNGDSSSSKVSYSNCDIEWLRKRQLDDSDKIGRPLPAGYAPIEEPDDQTVGILDPLPTGATTNFITSLHMWLPKGVKLKILDDTSKIDTHTFVICNNSSRLGADINATLSKTEKEQRNKIMIIVLHAKPEAQLPQRDSVESFQENNKDIKYVVDMAYTSDEKIYQCNMNLKARKKIEDYLQTNISTITK